MAGGDGDGHFHPKQHDMGDSTAHRGDIFDALTNPPNPVSGSNPFADVQYVDDSIATAIGDLIDKGTVDAATTGALPANTRTANVLKADAVGAFPTIDGVAAALNNTYLVKDEGGVASHINDGLYTLTVVGDGVTEWELTRNSNLTNGDHAAGAFIHVEQGTVNAESTFRCINNASADVVNTDALEFLYWGQTTDHKYLKNLAWSVAAHVIDTDIDMNANKLTDLAGVEATGSADITVKLGDNAGANKISFLDSDDAEIASLDSDGLLTLVNNIQMSSTLIDDDGTDFAIINTQSFTYGLGLGCCSSTAYHVDIQTDGTLEVTSEYNQFNDGGILVTQPYFWILGTNRTSGDVLRVEGDSIALTTGNLVNILNGASVFKIDKNGKMTTVSGTDINEFSIDGTLAGNSDDALPTEKAVKTYVDTQDGTLVPKSLFDATTFLYATLDDTPEAKTPAEVMAILSGQAGADFAMNTNKITGVKDPTASQDAATKIYVDDFFDTTTGHVHDGVDSKQVTHSDLLSIGTDDHHAQLHAASHQNGGGDEISVTGLSGLLADDQHVIDSEVISAYNTWKDYQYVESEAVQNETGGSYVLKTGASLQWTPPIAGDYIVEYSAEITNSSSSAECRAIIELDNGGSAGSGTELGFGSHEPETGAQYHMISGVKEVTLTQAAHRIDWAFLEIGGGTARMRRARITVWRVA